MQNGVDDGGNGSMTTKEVKYREMCWRHDEQIKTVAACQKETTDDIGYIKGKLSVLETNVALLPGQVNVQVKKETGIVVKKLNEVLVAAILVLIALMFDIYFR